MWNFIQSILAGISGIVLSQFKNYLRRELTGMVAELLPYARDVVVEVARDLLTEDDDSKRKEAVKRLRKKASEWYGDIPERVLNEAVEIAHGEEYDYIKKYIKGEK